MPSPVKPADFLAVIPSTSSPTCTSFVMALIQFPTRFYQFIKWFLNVDGTISTAAATEICAALTALGCASGGTTATTPGTGTTTSTTTIGIPPDAITDLEIGQGLGYGLSGVNMQGIFTATIGSVSYDIYRNTTNDINTASLITASNVPYPVATGAGVVDPTVPMYDNGDFISFYDSTNSSGQTVYYYWVKAKGPGGATSSASNLGVGASGWAGQKSPYNNGYYTSNHAMPYVNPSFTKLRVVAYGAASAGAGGGEFFGGGGGGGGATAIAEYVIAPGDTISVTGNAQSAANTASETSAGNATDMVVLINAVEVMRLNASTGGLYNGAGGGAGGAAGTVTFSSGANQVTLAGRDGNTGSGVSGGMAGCNRFGRRLPMNHLNSNWVSNSGDGGGAIAGGGSRATEDGNIIGLATGGSVTGTGYVYFQLGN